MPEIWDGYTKDFQPAGVDLVRGEAIPEGLYHLVSEILVRHTDGDYLLMKRHPEKEAYPGYYEATAGGSALKGENALACARRELKEETGITVGMLAPVCEYTSGDTHYRCFVCVTNADKNAVTLQPGETVSFKWVNEKEFIAYLHSKYAIPPQKARFSPYFEKLGYL